MSSCLKVFAGEHFALCFFRYYCLKQFMLKGISFQSGNIWFHAYRSWQKENLLSQEQYQETGSSDLIYLSPNTVGNSARRDVSNGIKDTSQFSKAEQQNLHLKCLWLVTRLFLRSYRITKTTEECSASSTLGDRYAACGMDFWAQFEFTKGLSTELHCPILLAKI